MHCPKCNEELKINWITKEAECMSCHKHYHLRFRKMNVFTYFVCIVIIAVYLSQSMLYIAGDNQYIWPLLLTAFNLAVFYLMPRKQINKILYKLCEEEKE